MWGLEPGRSFDGMASTTSLIKRLASRHTTAVAYLALFAALGGSAYAQGEAQ